MTTTPDGLYSQNQVQSSTVASDLPAWYQQYTQNLANTAAAIGTANVTNPLPAQSVAGFNPDQVTGFDATRANQGNWLTGLENANGANTAMTTIAGGLINGAQGAVSAPAGATADQVTPYATQAVDSVSGPAQDWTSNYQKYMNPYTSDVVDNIARLGKNNWENNIMPGVNSSMIGSGQFGSTRNADVLTRAGLTANQDIMGQQSSALQAGYNGAANIFASDANRAQQQEQLQANTNISGGNLVQGALSGDANRTQNQGQIQANTALTGANAVGTIGNAAVDNAAQLAQQLQSMGITDVNQLQNQGALQQALQQKGYDTAFNNAQLARTDPWTQLNNTTGALSSIQLPKTTTTTNQTAMSGSGGTPPSTLSQVGSAATGVAGILSALGLS